MCKVSVVIAAYNVEKYIQKCLNSIMSQTFSDIEIIVVNDGSTDNTLEKILEIASTDSRVKIINQKNSGISEVRNRGIKEANGEFLIFVDGDDWLEKNALDNLYKKATAENLDLICYNHLLAYDDKEPVAAPKKGFDLQDGKEALRLLMTDKISASVWGKFIKKQVLDKSNVLFSKDIRYGEDLLFFISLITECKKVAGVDQCYYYYYQRENSVTKKESDKILDVKKSISEIRKILKDSGILEELTEEFSFLKYLHLYYYRVISCSQIGEFQKKFYKEYKMISKNIKSNKYYGAFISKLNTNMKIRIKAYNISYYIGISYVKLTKILK